MKRKSSPITCFLIAGTLFIAPILCILALAFSPYILAVLLIAWAGIIIVTALTNGLFGGQ